MLKKMMTVLKKKKREEKTFDINYPARFTEDFYTR